MFLRVSLLFGQLGSIAYSNKYKNITDHLLDLNSYFFSLYDSIKKAILTHLNIII